MSEPLVTIKNGTLRGEVARDYRGVAYYSFKGIPYAKAPVGPLRFKAPAPADDWQGIRDATKHGSICISKDFITGRVSGTEDCLFINVYTPTLPTNGDGCKPVMCWVPGGGFVSGSVDFELEIPFIWNVPKGSSLSMKLAEEIKSFYFGSEKPSQKNTNRYYQLQGDSHFTWPLHFTLSHFIDSHSSTIYIYRMSVDTELNLMKKVSEEPGPSVCHADDLGYLFMNPATLPPPEQSTEMKTVKRFIKLWANFARTGNPNSKVTDSLISVLWKPVEKDRVHFLEIGENLTVGVNPDEDRIAFWWKLFRFAQRK